MPRYALKLEYDGTGFVGWQRQDNGISIQEVLENAAGKLVGGASVVSVVAGRTDAGVHAQGQVANIDLDRELTPVTLREALNFHMKPRRVVVLDAAIVGPDWNARFAAIGRAYRYRVLNRRARAALLADHVWHVQKPLDAAAMHDAAQILVGRHDFTSFRAAACQARTPWRTVDRIDVTRDHDVIEMAIEARSFLHHMVRNIMGTLKLVGEGRWPPERVAEILAAQDRGVAGPTAPSTGLALVAVSYPTDPFST